MAPVQSKKIIDFLKGISQYVNDNKIETAASEPTGLDSQSNHSFCWCKKKNIHPKPIICSILIVGKEFQDTSSKTAIIQTKNPKYAYLKVLEHFFLKPVSSSGIHPSAILSKGFILGENVSIGANSVLIGEGTIANNTIIHPNVTIRGPISIGSNVEIHPGCVLGYDGFGYAKAPETEYEKFPHLKGIVIEDHVEIGANSCVDKGILTNTIIRAHTKIDKACLIAHGVIIGKSCMIAGFTNIGGSVVIGNNSWLSPKSTILNGITIEDDTFIGIGSVVLRSVKKGTTVFGNPAKVIKKASPSG